jgi:sialic acid synthase SpsE
VNTSRPSFLVGERAIGDDAPVFVVAEAGVNHNGDPSWPGA